MKVKTLIRFTDLKENTIREVGDEFEANKSRVIELLSASSTPLIEEVIEVKIVKKEKTIETATKKKK